MATTETLLNLKIHKLASEDQYDDLVDQGQIGAQDLCLIPDKDLTDEDVKLKEPFRLTKDFGYYTLEKYPGRLVGETGQSIHDFLQGAFAESESVIVTFNIKSANTTVTLQNLPNARIDWGDGTLDESLTHQYVGTGTYTCKIYNIESIGDNAFYRCAYLTNVVITDNVTSIGEMAFYSCSSLTSIIIPNSVTSIGSSAFYICSNLTSVVIGDNVQTIDDYAFYGCTNLTSIKIPDSVTSIGSSAFYYCDNLTDVVIGDNVQSIGSGAFSNCSRLTGIVINAVSPPSLTNTCFRYCSNLNAIRVPSESLSAYKTATGWLTYADKIDSYVKTSTANAFTDGHVVMWKENVNKFVDAGDGLIRSAQRTRYNTLRDLSIVGGTFNDTLLVIPEGTIEIEANKYLETAVKVVAIPYGVTSIGYGAFSGCTGLTSVVIPDSVQSIATAAFYNCNSLKSVEITNGTTFFGAGAFQGCHNLTSVYYTGTIDDWAQIAFEGVDANPAYFANTSLYINNNLVTKANLTTATKISDYAFHNCDSLATVDLSSSVQSIGSFAFSHCGKLTGIKIPDSVTSIGNNAFSACRLTNVVIGDGVTSIGDSAFYNCGYLASVEIGDSVQSIGDLAFEGCSSLTSVVIPNSVTSIGDRAFLQCVRVKTLEIGGNVTNIGNRAFYSCTSLLTIKFNGKIEAWNNITKGSDWKVGVTATAVVCSDGSVPL